MTCFYVDLNPARNTLDTGELYYSSKFLFPFPAKYFKNQEMYAHLFLAYIP